MSTFALTTTYVQVTCANVQCGIVFALESGFRRQRLNDHGWFYCPNGHSQRYTGDSEATQERKKREAAERTAASLRADARFWRERAREEERSKAAVRGHLTRKKKELRRVSAGVCPCCEREFQNLKRHMKSQHPDFEAPGTGGGE